MLTLEKVQEVKTYLAHRADHLTSTLSSKAASPPRVSLPEIPLQKHTSRGLVAGGLLTGAGLALLAVSLRRAATEERPQEPRVRLRQDGATIESSEREAVPTLMGQKLAHLVEKSPELVEKPERVEQILQTDKASALSKSASLAALPTFACIVGMMLGASSTLALGNGVPIEEVATVAAEEYLQRPTVENESEGDDG